MIRQENIANDSSKNKPRYLRACGSSISSETMFSKTASINLIESLDARQGRELKES